MSERKQKLNTFFPRPTDLRALGHKSSYVIPRKGVNGKNGLDGNQKITLTDAIKEGYLDVIYRRENGSLEVYFRKKKKKKKKNKKKRKILF